jgi:hypothetical protein
MQRLEVSCAVRPIYGSLGAKGLRGGAAGQLPGTPIYKSALRRDSNNRKHVASTFRGSTLGRISPKCIRYSDTREFSPALSLAEKKKYKAYTASGRF